MDDLDYLYYNRDDDPIPERYDNGNIGGIISAIAAWVMAIVILVIIFSILGAIL